MDHLGAAIWTTIAPITRELPDTERRTRLQQMRMTGVLNTLFFGHHATEGWARAEMEKQTHFVIARSEAIQ